MRRFVALLLALAPAAQAGPVLDRIRADQVLRCGAVPRPGLAFPGPDGVWHGLEVEICRAAAVAIMGPAARSEVHAYTEVDNSLDPLRRGTDALAFLTASDMLRGNLLSVIVPGPAVFYASSGVMVPEHAAAHHLADLAGTRVCAEPGTGPERSLLAWFAARGLPLAYSMFQEPDEMMDAFYGGRCEAVAQDLTSLAALRLQAEADGHPARILPEPLAAVPVMAATLRGDDDWNAIVAWTVFTLIRAETLGSASPGGGPEPLPLAGAALGLRAVWQADVLAATGDYGRIFSRTLGAGSPLGLARGLNALWTDGGLMCPPFSE